MHESISSYLLVALLSGGLSYLALRFSKDKKIAQDASVLATVLTKLDNIIKTVEEIRLEMKNQEKTNKEHSVRLAKVEVDVTQLRRELKELRANG